MSSVSFDDAFDRWYKLTEAERMRLESERGRGAVILSWEALDHLCGLAVESGMKALMLKEKMEAPDRSGDFPKNRETNRRPHVDELWDLFIAKASGRKMNDWVKRLGGGSGPPTHVFREWRAEHRYAVNGTVPEAVLRLRLQMAKRLKSIAEEEGL